MDHKAHPRRPVWGLWALLTLALAGTLFVLRAAEVLPLPYAHRVPPVSLSAALPLTLVIGATLTLPLAIWLGHLKHWRAILRPTAGKLWLATGLSLLIPGLILETGRPLFIGPFYLFFAVAEPNAMTLTGALVYFALALAVLYPAGAALIWGLTQKTRPLAFVSLPVGFYGLLYLLGGTF